jgi:hypothetical protein
VRRGIELKHLEIVSFLLLILCFQAAAQKAATVTPTASKIPELNTLLMQSTFKVQGPKAGDRTKVAFGTAFLMGRVKKAKPSEAWYVVITAAHVFEDIEGDDAQLVLRKQLPDKSFTTYLHPLKLRDKGKNLYYKHPSADVAAVFAVLPKDLNITTLATDFLADDDKLEEFELHPGDFLNCLGFPLYVDAQGGFPILRSGKISSYPLTPSSVYKTFEYEFPVFEGNSGGPVYFVDQNRIYNGQAHLGGPIQFIVGLVSQQIGAKLFDNQKIGLGVVVPAHFIIETLALLPEPQEN